MRWERCGTAINGITLLLLLNPEKSQLTTSDAHLQNLTDSLYPVSLSELEHIATRMSCAGIGLENLALIPLSPLMAHSLVMVSGIGAGAGKFLARAGAGVVFDEFVEKMITKVIIVAKSNPNRIWTRRFSNMMSYTLTGCTICIA
jgi:hypothetical protein